jgi:predicted oxidoreductase
MSNDSYRTLGTSGLRVSPLALGTMTFDDGTWGAAPELSHQILDRYLDAGGNFLDTANQYNGGLPEETRPPRGSTSATTAPRGCSTTACGLLTASPTGGRRSTCCAGRRRHHWH